MSSQWSVLSGHPRVLGSLGALVVMLVLAVGAVAASGDLTVGFDISSNGVSLVSGP